MTEAVADPATVAAESGIAEPTVADEQPTPSA